MATETVAVVIPWAGGCPHRLRALAFVRRWYTREFCAWSVVVGVASAEPWCKARAAMPAIAASTADIIVLADADVICTGTGLAVGQVARGKPWAIPHDRVVRLDQAATEQLLETGVEGETHAERPHAPMIGGGILVARRDVLLDAPLDPRFVGWGQEDDCHGRALRSLYGEPWQGSSDLLHLWHPPQQRQSRSIGSDESWALRRRYRSARNDPAAMRELLREAW